MSSDTALAPPAGAARPGRNALGTISVSVSVVQKLAARAAAEIPSAGAAAPRVMGRSVTTPAALGGRQTSLTALPRASADLDGMTAALDLTISIRWPASVPAVSNAVREHVRDRVSALTGLDVASVSIAVTDLAAGLDAQARVR